MVINGVPRLACETFVRDLGDEIEVKPLQKFPVIHDLMVDRSSIQENLKRTNVYIGQYQPVGSKDPALQYSAARCLKCGLCLEVCPNFLPGGSFTGTAACVPASRIIAEMESPAQTELGCLYRKRIYEGCGKSLSCRNICPAGIDIDKLLVHSNAAAVWNKSVHSPGKMLH